MYYVKAQIVYNGDTLKTHSNTQLATLILAIRNRYRKLLRSFVKSALTASGFSGAGPLRGYSVGFALRNPSVRSIVPVDSPSCILCASTAWFSLLI